MNILNHVPALYVLLPIFGALFCAISFNINTSRIIAIIFICLALTVSIYGNNSLTYSFGNWKAPIGIEYKIDLINKPIIIYINAVLMFLLLFCNKLIKEHVTDCIKDQYKHLFYSILLFSHAGFVGILATNDLFNLYVFIEISSLTAYVLMSLGNNNKAVIGAFDYLIMGSIGASLILISIGFLLSITGSLNIDDISQILSANNLYDTKITLVAFIFFIIGSILKIAFFPMHFWMLRAYNSASAIILVYLGGIGSAVGVYIFYRFTHNVLNYELIKNQINLLLSYPALAGILLSSFYAIKAKNLRKIIVYSGCSSICYIVFFLSASSVNSILAPLILIDSINKMGLFLIASYYDSNKYRIKNILYYKYLITLILLCSCGLPLTSMFIIKVNMLKFLLTNHLLIEFIIFIIGFIFALIYHYKIAIILLPSGTLHRSSETRVIAYDLIFVITVQLICLIYFNRIAKLLTGSIYA